METNEVAYLLLQNRYLKMILEKDNYSEEEVLKMHHKLFPTDWTYIDFDLRNKLIAKAIKEKKNLIEVYEREMNEDINSPKLG